MVSNPSPNVRLLNQLRRRKLVLLTSTQIAKVKAAAQAMPTQVAVAVAVAVAATAMGRLKHGGVRDAVKRRNPWTAI